MRAQAEVNKHGHFTPWAQNHNMSTMSLRLEFSSLLLEPQQQQQQKSEPLCICAADLPCSVCLCGRESRSLFRCIGIPPDSSPREDGVLPSRP